MIRAALGLLIRDLDGFIVLAEADSCEEIITHPDIGDCDVVVVCLEKHSTEWIAPIRQLLGQDSEIRVVLLVGDLDRDFYTAAVRTGVQGIIDKSAEPGVFLKALKAVKKGEVWLDRRMMIEAISDLSQKVEDFASGNNGDKASALTDREREVLGLVCQGFKNKEIAERLFISPATVRHHLTSIFNKADVSDRLELVLYAFRNHIESPPI